MNFASRTSQHTKVVIDHGVVPKFVQLVSVPSDDVREQAIWDLGNVANDSPKCKDLLLGHGASCHRWPCQMNMPNCLC